MRRPWAFISPRRVLEIALDSEIKAHDVRDPEEGIDEPYEM